MSVREFPLDNFDFPMEVETIVQKEKCTYMEALLILAERIDWEPEWLAPHINGVIKEKLRVESENAGLMRKRSNPAYTFE